MKVRLSPGAFLAIVIVACSAWLVFYAQGAAAREADKRMQLQVAKGFFSGAVLVSRDGKVIFEHAYGMADAEAKTSNALDTRFRIGSVTKTFTAILVMQLEGERRLAVTDPICKYLDECPSGWAQITLHHLLSHTSGIYDYTRGLGDAEKVKAMMATHHDPAEIFARFVHEPLAFAPGEKFEYSNSNYWLLTRVIEKVSGQSYEDALRQRIFEPAGMHDSGLTHDWTRTEHAAVGYWMTKEGKIERAPVVDGSLSSGDGGAYSTVLDLQKFSDALDHDSFVPRATLERMRTPVEPVYGYGWSLPPVSALTLNRKQVNHGGALPGFLSAFQRFEGEKLTVIVLSNSQRSDPQQVAQALGSAVFGEPFTPLFERESVEVPEAVLQRYAGDYDLEGTLWTVFVRDGHLFVRAKDGSSPDLPLLAQSETLFFIKGTDSDITVTEDAKGEVTGLALSLRDASRYAKKVR